MLVDAERLADALAARFGRTPTAGPGNDWLDVEAAAQRLRCPTSRMYDLKATGRSRDTSKAGHSRRSDDPRLLFRREWLDDALQIHPDQELTRHDRPSHGLVKLGPGIYRRGHRYAVRYRDATGRQRTRTVDSLCEARAPTASPARSRRAPTTTPER